MRRGAVFAALLTGLALAMCPVAQAEPTADDWYTKALVETGSTIRTVCLSRS